MIMSKVSWKKLFAFLFFKKTFFFLLEKHCIFENYEWVIFWRALNTQIDGCPVLFSLLTKWYLKWNYMYKYPKRCSCNISNQYRVYQQLRFPKSFMYFKEGCIFKVIITVPIERTCTYTSIISLFSHLIETTQSLLVFFISPIL